MTHVVLIHGGKSTAPKLAAAWPGAEVVIVYRKGLSAAYNEATGLARDFPTLRALLATFAPKWKPGEPLVLLGFSAGGWALRYYLRDAEARDDITAAIFLDATYGPTDKVDLSPYRGTVAFGKLANLSPASKRLVMTWSQAHPAPALYAHAIEEAAGAGPGIMLRGYDNANHGEQQSVAGPAAVAAVRAALGAIDSPATALPSSSSDGAAAVLAAVVLYFLT